MKGIKIFLADGFEDVEALGTNDVLRRGGVHTELISIIGESLVESSHGVTIGADGFLNDLDTSHEGTTEKDVMIFPGGMPGSKALAACEPLIQLMKEHYAAGGTIAAICAAPGLVFSQLDDVKGLEFTCFDGFQDALIEKGATFRPEPAVHCGRIISGRSAGHAISFGLEILRTVKDEATAESVRHAMYLQ